jgi:uncharacterized protein YbjT (DUF2867 family)
MATKTIQAVIFGATGLAGSGVLDECLKHPGVIKVTVVSRRSTGKKHAKLNEIIHQNFLDYSSIENGLKGHNACFYCLGVSQTKVRDEKKYHEMTYDFAMAAAKALSEVNEELTFCFLSGAGTDPTMKSRFMWARIKGKAERDLESIPFKKLYIFRPGFIQPVGGKKHSLTMTRIISPFYPVLYKLFPSFITNTEEFGLAMINAVLFGSTNKIFENRDIRKMAKIKDI